MSFECPSCHEKTIPAFKKFRSARLNVFLCSNCGAAVYAGGVWKTILQIAQYTMALYLGFLLFLNQDLAHLLLFFGGWMVFELVGLVAVPLRVSDAQRDT